MLKRMPGEVGEMSAAVLVIPGISTTLAARTPQPAAGNLVRWDLEQPLAERRKCFGALSSRVKTIPMEGTFIHKDRTICLKICARQANRLRCSP
jgi:hypothetical protein